jgi:hypothetical protein
MPPIELFYKLSIKQPEIQNSVVSEATPYHHNVFTFTLFLQEGRAGVAWGPSSKMILFLPPRKIKCLSLHPLISYLNLLFIYPSHLPSLSLSLSLHSLTQTICALPSIPLSIIWKSLPLTCEISSHYGSDVRGTYCLHHQGSTSQKVFVFTLH